MARAKRLQGESVYNWIRQSSKSDSHPRGKRMQGTSVEKHIKNMKK